MISGHNTNVLHRGVLFHVQTEASAREPGRLTTQVFQAGNVLASETSQPSDVSEPAADAPLRRRMAAQHRGVVERLETGEYDAQICERLGPGVFGERARPAHRTRSATGGETDSATASEGPAGEPTRDDARAPGASRDFGDGVVSDKPLDELVLEYLVDNARRRRKRGGS